MRVRGLRASMRASTRRLKAMAADRAHTIATTIHKSIPRKRHHAEAAGWPAAARSPMSRQASRAPVRAKGRANTECSNRIMSSVNRRRFQIIGRIPHFTPWYDRVELR